MTLLLLPRLERWQTEYHEVSKRIGDLAEYEDAPGWLYERTGREVSDVLNRPSHLDYVRPERTASILARWLRMPVPTETTGAPGVAAGVALGLASLSSEVSRYAAVVAAELAMSGAGVLHWIASQRGTREQLTEYVEEHVRAAQLGPPDLYLDASGLVVQWLTESGQASGDFEAWLAQNPTA